MAEKKIPPNPGGYLEDDVFGNMTWHSYGGKDLHGDAAAEKFLKHSDGSSETYGKARRRLNKNG